MEGALVNTFALVGAGNVGTHLGKALAGAGYQPSLLFSRSEAKGAKLGQAINAPHTVQLEDLSNCGADLLIVAVPDDQLPSIADRLQGFQGIVAHTSGTVSIDVLKAAFKQAGVFYPLQTFSATVPVNFREVPVCIEGSTQAVAERLNDVAQHISDTTRLVDSEARAHLHMAAVLVNNFTNFLYDEAETICRKQDLPFSLLEPLARETTRKAFMSTPQDTQTGPARRGDAQVIEKHLKMLDHAPEIQQLYRLLSEAIMKKYPS